MASSSFVQNTLSCFLHNRNQTSQLFTAHLFPPNFVNRLWFVLHLACSSWFTGVGLVVAHHHPEIYHEGDAMREDRDWGLCQLDAVRDRYKILSFCTRGL